MKRKVKQTEPEIDRIDPVNEVIEIPAALIEILELVHRLEEKRIIERDRPLDEITGSDLEYVEITANLKEVINSCIQAIKTDGLKQMRLSATDLRLLSEAVHCWMGTLSQNGALTDCDGTAMTFLIRGLQILMESNEPEPEMIRTVNPIPNEEKIQ